MPNSGSILVVDDEPHNVKLLAIQLSKAGYTPIEAYGGEQALRQSAGVASFGVVDRSARDLLAGADAARYAAKGEARNRVCMASARRSAEPAKNTTGG